MSRDREERSGRGRDRDDSRSSRGRGDDREERGGRGGRDRDDDRSSRSSRGGRSGFVYHKRSADDVKKRAEHGGGSDFDVYFNRDIKMYKPKDGDNTIRILPPTWEGAEHYGLDVFVHYGVGPDRQTYLCLHKMKGEPCPICEERQRAQRSGDEEYAKELEPKRRVVVYLIDRDAEKEGVQAYAMPQGTDQDIVKISVDKRTGEVFGIDNPDEGFDVMFERTGTGIKTRYEGIQLARRESSLGNDDWLQFAVDNPIPDQLVYYSYDRIAQEFGGSGEHRESRDRDDRSDSKSKQRDDEPRQRGRSRDADEPELTWDGVHAMTSRELDDLVEAKRLDIKPNDANDDEELADWICEDLGIKKETPRRTRVQAEEPDKGDVKDRFRRMRGD